MQSVMPLYLLGTILRSFSIASFPVIILGSPKIGYDNAAKIAKMAHKENLTLREACAKAGLISPGEYDDIVKPEKMAKPYGN